MFKDRPVFTEGELESGYLKRTVRALHLRLHFHFSRKVKNIFLWIYILRNFSIQQFRMFTITIVKRGKSLFKIAVKLITTSTSEACSTLALLKFSKP